MWKKKEQNFRIGDKSKGMNLPAQRACGICPIMASSNGIHTQNSDTRDCTVGNGPEKTRTTGRADCMMTDMMKWPTLPLTMQEQYSDSALYTNVTGD